MDQDRATPNLPSVKTAQVAPFSDAPTQRTRPVTDVGRFAPQKAKDDLHPAQGVDLSGQAKIIFVIGRGKTGKTTLLRWMAEQALDETRPFLMADIDPTNASFSSYFPNVSRPTGYDPVEVREWLLRFIAYALEQKTTAIIDLGGGDTALRSLLTEMPTVFADIAAAGLAPVALYMCGPQPDDLAPIVTLSSHGFAPDARAIVFNEGVADAGLPREQSFADVVDHPVVQNEIQDGALVLWMPRLFAAAAVENRRTSFGAARDGQTEVALNMFDRTRVRAWLDAMAHRFSGVRSWMP
jgi:hypothetical protein